MDRVVPGRTLRPVAIKLVVDQVLQGPLMIASMFGLCALANGASGSKFVLRLDGGRLTVFRALRSGAADVRDVVGTVNLPF